MIMKQFFNCDLSTGKELNSDYVNANPYPHIIIDRFLNFDLAEHLHWTYPSINDYWYNYDTVGLEKKRAIDDITKMPDQHAKILLLMNSSPIVKFLEDLTGISGLIPDPHFRGGGLHQITQGGRLALHSDFNFHKDLGLHRRLNVLIYLNRYYKPEYGGQLELWDKNVRKCIQKIDPVYNRMVCFNTTDDSVHGHPELWHGPATRKSMAFYYYTADRPLNEISEPHSTMFKLRPQDEKTPEILDLIERRNKGRLKTNVTK